MRPYSLVAMAFILVACAGDTSQGDEEDSTTTSSAAPTTLSDQDGASTTVATITTTGQAATASTRDTPVDVGAVVQVGDWRLRVAGVTPDATDEVLSENQFNDPPPEGNQFFIATVEATYTSDESSTFWIDMSLKAVGDSNVAYEAFEASCGVIPDDINDSGETFPGGTITGNVCWNIRSEDADSLIMIA
jgi:hypothetical protein